MHNIFVTWYIYIIITRIPQGCIGKLNGRLISKRKYNMLFKSINVFVSEKCLNLFIRNTVVFCRCIMKLMLSYSSWKLKSLCTVARYQSLLHLFPYLFICSFTYTCVCILIQALDKSLQRRTYYYFSIKLDFIFRSTPLIMLFYWFNNMNACHCNVWDEKPQINLVIWNMIFEFLSQLHESNLAYIFSLRMVLAHAVQWNLTYLKYVSM